MSEPLSFEELASAAKPEVATEPQATPAETQATPAVEEAKPQFTDADVTAYQTMRDLGITPENAKEFTQAKQWLETIAYSLQNDPQQFIEELRKTNPQMADKFIEVASDDWYNRKGKYMNTEQSNGGQSNAPKSDPAVDSRIDSLMREVDSLKKERQAEVETRRQAEVTKAYNESFDSLVAKLPESLPEQTKEYIRLKAEKMLFTDNAARGRINQGNFTDVPKFFAEASRRVTAETKATAQKETAARAAVVASGSKEITPASENVTGASQARPGQDPIWGDINEKEIAAAYKR